MTTHRSLLPLLGLAFFAGLPIACGLDAEGIDTNSGEPTTTGSGGGGTTSSSTTTSTTSTSTTSTSSTSSSGGGGTGGATPCNPGDTVDCYDGPAGTQNVGPCTGGTMTCLPDGSAFGPCVGQVLPAAEDCASPEDEDCDGLAFAPLDGDCACVPGSPAAPCYEGPAGTEGVGPCLGGTHSCNADGLGFDACAGQVLPAVESCATAIDEDCDGLVYDDAADGCICAPASTQSCATGMPGACAAGTQTCTGGGTAWGPCGAIAQPSFDDCQTAADEDCDGAAPGCTGNPISGEDLGIAASNADDVAYAVTSDAAGNTIIGGVANGTVAGFEPSAGAMHVAKFDAAANLLWQKTASAGNGGGNFAVVRAVRTDAANNVLLAGTFNGTLNLGGADLVSSGTEIFVAKLSPSGAHVWSQRFGDAAYQAAYGLAVDGNGAVIVTGRISGNVNFGGGALGNAGGIDVFVVKLNALGAHQWSKRFGDASDQIGWAIHATATGDVVVAGECAGNINFGPGNLAPNGGGVDAFVVALSGGAGAQIWGKRYGDAQDQAAYAVAADPLGGVAVAGRFRGAIDFGGGALTNTDNATSDAFVAKLDGNAAGAHVWSKRFGDALSQTANGVALDGAGNVIVTGEFRGTIDLGGGALTDADNAANDVFIAKLGSAAPGAHLWSKRAGDAADQRGWAAATTPANGEVLLAGGYAGTMAFGAPVPNFTSFGGYDIYTVRFAP